MATVAPYLQTRLVNHVRRVCNLYKRAIRNEESWSMDRATFRYKAVLLRQRFEKYRHEKDLRKARQILEDGEKELEENMHYQPKKFATSPGGVAHERTVETPDWCLDYWHPLEKAQYPEYFARREQRKKEYIENWEKKYGKPEATE